MKFDIVMDGQGGTDIICSASLEETEFLRAQNLSGADIEILADLIAKRMIKAISDNARN